MNKFITFIKKNKLLEGVNKVSVALSGGPDSMALLQLLYDHKDILNIELSAVHIHHGLRAASDDEALFVEAHCKKLLIACTVRHVDVHALVDKGMSVEAAARACRYKVFESVLQDENMRIALAHHMDDQAETVLLNLFRGSGLKGLGGMKPRREAYIRPLLEFSRQEILKYCEKQHIPYVTDESNYEMDYTRNLLRLKIIPQIEADIQPRLLSHIANTAKILQEEEAYLHKIMLESYETVCTTTSKNLVVFNRESMIELPGVILKRVLRYGLDQLEGGLFNITTVHIKDMLALCIKGETGKQIDLPSGRIMKCSYNDISIENMIITDKRQLDEVVIDIAQLVLDRTSYFASFSVKKTPYKKDGNFPKKIYTKCFDYDKIRGKLLVRSRQNGDYILVNQLQNKKKIKDYLIDKKIPREDRNLIPMFAVGKEVIWIVGYRINEAYKVTELTDTLLEVRYFKEET